MTLLSGNVFAQLIPFVFSPILSRYFTPEQFGELALYMSITNPIAILICLRYEAAIVIPEKEEHAKDLLRISIRITFLISLLTAIVSYLLLYFYQGNTWMNKAEPVLPWIAPVMLAIGISGATGFYFQRKKQFKTIALFKVIQMGGITLFNLAFAFLTIKNGLILGYFIGWALCAGAALWYVSVNQKVKLLRKEDYQVNYLKKYRHFPLYNGIPEFLTTIALSIPVFIFMDQFGEKETGYLNLSRQVLYFPASFIAVSLSQYYFQQFSEFFREKKSLTPTLMKIAKLTLPIALLMALVVYFFGPVLFSFVFGEQWYRSGELSVILVVLFAFQLCIIPMQTLFSATGFNSLFGLFKMMSFAYCMMLLIPTYTSPREFLLIYVGGEATIWLFSLFTVFYLARQLDFRISHAQ